MRKVKRVLIEYDNGETQEFSKIETVVVRPSQSLLAGWQSDGSYRIMRDLIVTYTLANFSEIRPLIEVGQ